MIEQMANPQGKTSDLVERLRRIIDRDNGHCGESTSERIAREREQEPIRQAASELTRLEEENGKLRAEAEELRQNTVGWLYISDDGIEWSPNHPLTSGEVPDARSVRPATAAALLDELKAAWEAQADAVASEGRLRDRAAAERAKADDLQSLNVEAVGVLEEIANESVFSQQRFAEDTDTDYFLRCFKAVKDSARSLLSRLQSGSENKDLAQPGRELTAGADE